MHGLWSHSSPPLQSKYFLLTNHVEQARASAQYFFDAVYGFLDVEDEPGLVEEEEVEEAFRVSIEVSEADFPLENANLAREGNVPGEEGEGMYVILLGCSCCCSGSGWAWT